MEPSGRQAFALFPMIEAREFFALESADDLPADVGRGGAVELPKQQPGQDRAHLRHAERRRDFFSPPEFPE